MLQLISVDNLTRSELAFYLETCPSAYADKDYLNAFGRNWKIAFDDTLNIGIFLFVGKKAGMDYAYQPPFLQQFSFLGPNANSNEAQQLLIQNLTACFKLTEINLAASQLKLDPSWHTKVRRNAVLALNLPYEEIKKGYSQNHKRALAKFNQAANIEINPGLPAILEAIEIFEDESKKKYRLQKGYSNTLKVLLSAQALQSKFTSYRIMEGNQLAAFLLVYENKGVAVNLLSFATEVGRASNALFGLVDHAIKQRAEKFKAFDFEGSDNEGIFRFYKGFGAQNIPYLHVRNNNLPFIIRWLKSK